MCPRGGRGEACRGGRAAPSPPLARPSLTPPSPLARVCVCSKGGDKADTGVRFADVAGIDRVKSDIKEVRCERCVVHAGSAMSGHAVGADPPRRAAGALRAPTLVHALAHRLP